MKTKNRVAAEPTVPTRIREDDWMHLKSSRGMGNLPERVHELVEMEPKYKALLKENEKLKTELEQLKSKGVER